MTTIEAPAVKPPPGYPDAVIDQFDFLAAKECIRLDITDHRELRILDPMAGAGGIHRMKVGTTTGIELEPEWAAMSKGTTVGDALDLPFEDDSFDMVAVSPTYANRYADTYDGRDGSRRYTYRIALGRMPSEGSSAVMQYGQEYRDFHEKAWREATRVLRPSGLFVLNCADHIRGGKVIQVAEWHTVEMFRIGYCLEGAETISTRKMRHGRNGEARTEGELVIAFRAPAS